MAKEGGTPRRAVFLHRRSGDPTRHGGTFRYSIIDVDRAFLWQSKYKPEQRIRLTSMSERGPLKTLFDRLDRKIRGLIENPSLRRLEQAFDATFNELESGDSHFKRTAALHMRHLWQTFNTSYPETEVFVRASHNEKSEYLSRVQIIVESMSAREGSGDSPPGAAVGCMLTHFYILSLAWNRLELINRFADALEPYLQLTYAERDD